MINEHQGEQAEVRVLASSRNWIEGTAEQQLKKTAGLAGMRLAVGLPDLHPGQGSPIGAAFAVEGWLYPALVGNAYQPGAEAEEYLARHEHARHWAEANRALIAARVLYRLGAEGQRRFDVCHNWIEQRELRGRTCWLHRKGAAPSTCGPLVIPGSRGAFSYLVLPIEASERSGYSLAHGAGRKWARTDSRARLEKRFTAKDLTRTELGTHVICEDRELLFEEAPQAYKNITVVIDDLVRAGLVQIVALLRPVVTYKVRR